MTFLQNPMNNILRSVSMSQIHRRLAIPDNASLAMFSHKLATAGHTPHGRAVSVSIMGATD
jgi:hypothetical protein